MGESDNDGSLFLINLENENHDEEIIPSEEMVNNNDEVHVPVEENIVNQPVVHRVINIRDNNHSVVNIPESYRNSSDVEELERHGQTWVAYFTVKYPGPAMSPGTDWSNNSRRP